MSVLTHVRRWFRRPRGPQAELLENMDREIAAYRRGGIAIGTGCYLHGVTMAAGDPIRIGDHCVLTYCTILGHDASPALFIPELQRTGLLDRISRRQPTVIHDRCFLGVHAVVLCGVSVGPNAIVGAGAVVTRDVPPGTVVAGNPARVICTVEEFVARHRAAMRAHPEWYPGLETPAPGQNRPTPPPAQAA